MHLIKKDMNINALTTDITWSLHIKKISGIQVKQMGYEYSVNIFKYNVEHYKNIEKLF